MGTFADYYPCSGWPANAPLWAILIGFLLASCALAWPVAHVWQRIFSQWKKIDIGSRSAWGLVLIAFCCLPQFSIAFASRMLCLFPSEILPGTLRLLVASLPFLPFAGTAWWVYGLPLAKAQSHPVVVRGRSSKRIPWSVVK